MTKTINKKKETKVTENKVCAILHSITTVIWLFNAGMGLAGSVSSGNKLGWNFWSDIAIAVVFGCCAVDYFLKWRKEEKEGAVACMNAAFELGTHIGEFAYVLIH